MNRLRKTLNNVVPVVRIMRTLPERLGRNKELGEALRNLAFAKTEQQRRDAFQQIAIWTKRKDLEAATAGANEAAKGFAANLLNSRGEVAQHALAVPYLGALAPLATLPASRWHYGAMLLITLLEMKKLHPGLGLGSNNFGLEPALSGLEIAQAWTLLGGYGHLFGTFATERALLFMLDTHPALEREFLNGISSEARKAAEKVVRGRDLYRFFYAIAAWRVSRWRSSTTRSVSLQLLQRLLDPPEDLSWHRLNWAHRRARQIAATRLHALLGVDLAGSQISLRSALRGLRTFSQIGFLDEKSESAGAASGLIDALDRYYADVFFTSPAASGRVLGHLREFKAWWGSKEVALDSRIEALMTQPSDWPRLPSEVPTHFVRLHVPDAGTRWTGEVRSWLAATEDESPWAGGNFLISPSRRREVECNVIDVYVGKNLEPNLVSHVARLLAERNEAAWSSSSVSEVHRGLWRSIAAFCLRLLQELVTADKEVHLEPVSATSGVGFAIAARSIESGCGRLTDFSTRVQDDTRRLELDALRSSALNMRERKGTWLVKSLAVCKFGRSGYVYHAAIV